MKTTPPVARRTQYIKPFYVMDLLARARALEAQGRSIVHMEIGEPDFVTPEPIIEAGQAALAAGHTHYTPALGLPELRQAIADWYAKRYGVAVDAGRIIVTPGSSGALQLAMSALVNPGEAVLMADPGYPCNRHFVRLVEGEPLSIPVGPESAYQLDAELVEQAWTSKTKAVMVASPSNPTGTLLSIGELKRIGEVARQKGGALIVDEIDHGLTYEGDAQTALSVCDDAFVINSFSKFFGMTGWRLGWLVAPPAYVDALDRLAQNIFLAAPTLSQHAALAAFAEESLAILEQRRQEFARRRNYLLAALRELGFIFPCEPQGAFYLYADCSALTDDSFRFAEELLEQAGVAITPGLDFGANQPEKHVRFAYTTNLANLQEGVDRIRAFLANR
jgi:aspartate/methionine/tyrosine aminotransferase